MAFERKYKNSTITIKASDYPDYNEQQLFNLSGCAPHRWVEYDNEEDIIITPAVTGPDPNMPGESTIITPAVTERGIVKRWRFMNNAELKVLEAEEAEAQKLQQKEQLWQACNRYQESKISVGGMIELKPFEGTSAKCGAIRQWIKDLWADYYTRKAQIEAGQEVSYNFDNNGDLPHTYLEAATEAGVI